MVEVRGYINDLLADKEYEDFFKGIENKDDFFASMVDAPIIYKGKPIGVINDIDFDDQSWLGVIWMDSILEVNLYNNTPQSVHLIKGGI